MSVPPEHWCSQRSSTVSASRGETLKNACARRTLLSSEFAHASALFAFVVDPPAATSGAAVDAEVGPFDVDEPAPELAPVEPACGADAEAPVAAGCGTSAELATPVEPAAVGCGAGAEAPVERAAAAGGTSGGLATPVEGAAAAGGTAELATPVEPAVAASGAGAALEFADEAPIADSGAPTREPPEISPDDFDAGTTVGEEVRV